MFAALGSDDEDTESRPVAKAASSKTEAKPTKKEPAVARGAERGRGGGRGRGRGRGGATAAGYSNDDGMFSDSQAFPSERLWLQLTKIAMKFWRIANGI